MDTISVGWGEERVEALYASSFRQRLSGLRGTIEGRLLIRGSSVHTFGLSEPIDVVAIDDRMRVTATVRVPPNRIAVIPGARIILEQPAGDPVPRHGDQMTFTHV
ncbi:MAG: hypothetical protein WB245_00745 [Acidimicrobiia bacterium]